MTSREFLLSCFPNNIDNTAKEFCALVTNEKGTAAIETGFSQAKAFAEYYADTANVYKQTDEMLDKTVSFFSYLERFTDETDAALRGRLKSIFYRNGDTLWGTPRNIVEVFRTYFSSGNIFISENTNENTDSNNLLKDGDFTDLNTWTITGGTSYKIAARFSKTYGVELVKDGTLSQKVTITPSKSYFLHWFMQGSCEVQFIDNNGRYWDSENKTWVTSETSTEFTHDSWRNESIYFIADSEITEVTVLLTTDASYCYVDYFRLFQKQPYGSFTIICQFTGSTADNALALAPGKSDTEIKPYYGYYNIDALTGAASGFATDIYNDLLNFVRPGGVKAYIEIINKDYFEEN